MRTYVQKHKFETLNFEGLVKEGVSAIRAALNDPNISAETKAKIAVPIVCKHMPATVNNNNKETKLIKIEISREELESRIKNLFGGRVCIGPN